MARDPKGFHLLAGRGRLIIIRGGRNEGLGLSPTLSKSCGRWELGRGQSPIMTTVQNMRVRIFDDKKYLALDELSPIAFKAVEGDSMDPAATS